MPAEREATRRATWLLLAAGLLACVVPVAPREAPGGAPGDGAGSHPPSHDDDRTSACAATPGQLMLERVNAIRAERGLGVLTADARIEEAAREHTRYQAERRRISHEGAGGSSSAQRLTAAGYQWAMVAENVGAGYATASAMVDGWMGSAGHRRTILSADAVHAGVGYERGGGLTPHYWTLKVAAPRVPAGATDQERTRILTRHALSCHP